jgi:aldose 1-epimerase
MQSYLFGRMPDGRPVHAFTLGEAGGFSATVIQFGARLAALNVPTKAGPRNVTLGFDTLGPYLEDRAYLGAVAGRFANRIARARFTLDGREYVLPANHGPNTLHGGTVGFDQAVWAAEPDGDALVLCHVSPDGDQGFPGQLDVRVRYAVSDMTLRIDYLAETSAPTVLNLANHAYFNLAASGTILAHTLSLAAEQFLPVTAELLPAGGPVPVAGTPFDFRTPHAVGARIDTPDAQLRLAGGYDHCYILSSAQREAAEPAARLSAEGIAMELLTTEPGVQLYTGNFLNGRPFAWRSGLCLENQHFPDSPNRPDFPTTILRPGATFRSQTLFRFSAG